MGKRKKNRPGARRQRAEGTFKEAGGSSSDGEDSSHWNRFKRARKSSDSNGGLGTINTKERKKPLPVGRPGGGLDEASSRDLSLPPNANSRRKARHFAVRAEKEELAHAKWLSRERDLERFGLNKRERRAWEKAGRPDVAAFVADRKQQRKVSRQALLASREGGSGSDLEDRGSSGDDTDNTDDSDEGNGVDYGSFGADTVLPRLPAIDWNAADLQPFVRNLWDGGGGDTKADIGGQAESESAAPRSDVPKSNNLPCGDWRCEASDALKQQRQALHIVVRGRCPPPVTGFDDKRLHLAIRRYFRAAGSPGCHMVQPTPVQRQCWPAMLCGAATLGIAPTGSGKTLAYLLPAAAHALARFGRSGGSATERGACAPFGPVVLVLLPTRELAEQVAKAAAPLEKLFGLRSLAIVGGAATGRASQLEKLRASPRPLIAATPGRLLELVEIGDRAITLRNVSLLVIDEADQMLILGFEQQLDALAKQVRPDRQVAMFSATFPLRLRRAASRWIGKTVQSAEDTDQGLDKVMGSDKQIVSAPADADSVSGFVFIRCATRVMQVDDSASELATSGTAACTSEASMSRLKATSGQQTDQGTNLGLSSTVRHTVRVCEAGQKFSALVSLVLRIRGSEAGNVDGGRNGGGILVFCRSTSRADAAAATLRRQCGERVAPLHGGLTQESRERNVVDFRAGKLGTLCATDLASRGLHFKRARYVVNVDAPDSVERYVHRVGRVGRAGAKGFAFCLISVDMKAERALCINLAPMLRALPMTGAGALVDGPSVTALEKIAAEERAAREAHAADVAKAQVDTQAKAKAKAEAQAKARAQASAAAAAVLATSPSSLDVTDINALRPSEPNPFAVTPISSQTAQQQDGDTALEPGVEKKKRWTTRGRRAVKPDAEKKKRPVRQKPGKKNKKKLRRR